MFVDVEGTTITKCKECKYFELEQGLPICTNSGADVDDQESINDDCLYLNEVEDEDELLDFEEDDEDEDFYDEY